MRSAERGGEEDGEKVPEDKETRSAEVLVTGTREPGVGGKGSEYSDDYDMRAPLRHTHLGIEGVPRPATRVGLPDR